MTHEEFVGKALAELIQDNVTVKFQRQKYYSKNAYSFFLGTTDEVKYPILLVNCQRRELEHWFALFIHEYCHYLQWKEDKQKWKMYDHECTLFFDYLSGKTDEIADSTVDAVQELEMDCDHRAVTLIDQYSLNVDVAEYIKSSNLYHISHTLMKKYRKFFIPYEAEVIAMMPSVFVSKDEAKVYASLIDAQYKFFLDKTK